MANDYLILENYLGDRQKLSAIKTEEFKPAFSYRFDVLGQLSFNVDMFQKEADRNAHLDSGL